MFARLEDRCFGLSSQETLRVSFDRAGTQQGQVRHLSVIETELDIHLHRT